MKKNMKLTESEAEHVEDYHYTEEEHSHEYDPHCMVKILVIMF
jgi:hypothetical protein